MKNIKELNEENLITELNSKKIKVIDFWAPWCQPCQSFSLIFEELSKNQYLTDKIDFIKVNIDENPIIATNYDIRSIPTIIILNEDNQEIERVIGLRSYEEWENKLKEIV